jgi:23S rRNA pseudouridine1911/1915/1917 synthase
MTHIGHPLLGDRVYGASFKSSLSTLSEAARDAVNTLNRQALHAGKLGFEHPRTGKALSFESPLPADMMQLLAAFTR